MYKEDLLWVWREWGVWIISTNRNPPLTPTTSTLRSRESTYQARAASLWPLATVAGAKLHYIYNDDDLIWVWRVWGILIISTNWESTSYTNKIHSQVPESTYQARAASLWPLATVASAKLQYIYIYIYKEYLIWVWRVWGVLIICTNWESTYCTQDIHIHSSSFFSQ
jgi:hypothetical protein